MRSRAASTRPREDRDAPGRAEQRVDRVLGVRHQSEYVPCLVGDARDTLHGAIHVVGVAQDDPARGRELANRLLVGVPAPSPCFTGMTSSSPGVHAAVNGVAVLSTRTTASSADELELPVRAQDPWQEAALAEDLEAVADAEHRRPVGREGADPVHRGREPRDRAAAEVVAVGEATGQDHPPGARGQLALGVPDGSGVRPEPLERELRVAVVVRAGEDHDGHERPSAPWRHSLSSSISTLSINGFASSSPHMRSTCAFAADGSDASSSRSTTRPTRAELTAKPSLRSDSSTACP